MASQGQVEISVESAEGLKRQITVRVPNTEIDREVDIRLKQVGKTAKLKGFRPGKVPAKVVRKRYGGQVRQEVMSEIIRSTFSHAVTQKQMNPALPMDPAMLQRIRWEQVCYQDKIPAWFATQLRRAGGK